MLTDTPRNLDRLPLEELDDMEPGLAPVDPDEGLVPPMIPEDPEHDRVVDPES